MKHYLSKGTFNFYYNMLFSDNHRTIIVGLQEINNLLIHDWVLLPDCKKALDNRLSELLLTIRDEALRRCIYRLCADSYSPELADICARLLQKEDNPDNRMSIIPVLYGSYAESDFNKILKHIDTGLTGDQIALAKCYYPLDRASSLNKKVINDILNSNDITSLRWLSILSNSQGQSERENSLLNAELFSELAKHDDIWVQKYALGTFRHSKNFKITDFGLEYTSFTNLNPQPKKWALSIMWRDENFINMHSDFIEEVLSPHHLFAECDERVREGIANGLNKSKYSDQIASCVIQWYSLESCEPVRIWLKACMSKWAEYNQDFKYAVLEDGNVISGPDIIASFTTVKQNIKRETRFGMSSKPSKIFISHSSYDKYYASALVDFFESLGARNDSLFCSSVPGYGIPLNEDVYSYLKKQFDLYSLHVFFLLSPHYYESVACLNEMGAAWMMQSKYTTILLPGFSYKEIEGAINPKQIALRFDDEEYQIKEQIGELKEQILAELNLPAINGVRWEQKRDSFLKAMKNNK